MVAHDRARTVPTRSRRGALRSMRPEHPLARRLAALMLALALLVPGLGAGQSTTPPAGAASDLVTLNFQDADLEVVLDAVARSVDFNYVVAPEVRRKVTVQGRVARRDLFDVLLAILEVHGLTAVRSGEVYKVIRLAAAQGQAVPVVVGLEPDPTRRPGELVTHIIHLAYGSAAEVARVLGSLVSREGSVALHPGTNVLVITDSVEKLQRHLRIIRSLDVPTAQEQFQVFPLRFADATSLATLLGQLFAGAPPAPPRPPAPAGRPAEVAEPGMPPAPPPLPPATEPGPSRPVILADHRTNSLLVTGSPATLERVQTLVTRLDAETPPPRGVHLYRVEHLRAKELAATLTQLFRRRGGDAGEAPGGLRPGPGVGADAGVVPTGIPPGPLPPGAGPGSLPDPEREGLATGEIRVIADEPTNTLLVTTSAPLWAALQPVLRQLDRMPRRVLIEILVAEIMLDDSTSLGIEWALRSERGIQIGGETFSVASGLDVGVPGIQPLPPGLFFVLQSGDILALLQAFSRVNRVNILSNPHVLASENKKAQIHVGQSVPVLTTQQLPATGVVAQAQTATSVITTTVDYVDTGVILTVTPRVSEDRFVALDVRQEVSDAIQNLVSATQSPVFTKRVAETSVVVGENETLVLGGLIEERKIRERAGIPFLSRIPILGYLFGTTTEAIRKTELLMLVTPRVVQDAGEAQSLSDELRRRTPELRREIERSAPPPPARTPGPGSALPDSQAIVSDR
jgi:general secretion pathway protein D